MGEFAGAIIDADKRQQFIAQLSKKIRKKMPIAPSQQKCISIGDLKIPATRQYIIDGIKQMLLLRKKALQNQDYKYK